jgi:hypothetical protein
MAFLANKLRFLYLSQQILLVVAYIPLPPVSRLGKLWLHPYDQCLDPSQLPLQTKIYCDIGNSSGTKQQIDALNKEKTKINEIKFLHQCQ